MEDKLVYAVSINFQARSKRRLSTAKIKNEAV